MLAATWAEAAEYQSAESRSTTPLNAVVAWAGPSTMSFTVQDHKDPRPRKFHSAPKIRTVAQTAMLCKL
eukprot:3291400-Amphidinium_carterae.1